MGAGMGAKQSSAGSCGLGIVQSREKVPDRKATFRPGKIGITAHRHSGEVVKVSQGGQGDVAGVTTEMFIVDIGGEPYAQSLLLHRIRGTDNYTVIFSIAESDEDDWMPTVALAARIKQSMLPAKPVLEKSESALAREMAEVRKNDELEEEVSDAELLEEPQKFVARRRGGVSAEATGAYNHRYVDWESPKFEKTLAQTAEVIATLKQCPFLSGVDPSTLEALSECVDLQSYDAEVVLHEEGELGRSGYVLISGSVNEYTKIKKRNRKRAPTDASDSGSHCPADPSDALSHDVYGHLVKSITPGTFFGEHTMLWGFRRESSICANEKSVIGKLKRDVFFNLVTRHEMALRSERESLLRQIEFFDMLSEECIAKLADAVELLRFEKGEPVIKQGEVGNCLYAIHAGEACATIAIGMGTAYEDVQEHRRYGPGDRFGELGFMKGGTRGATVTAHTPLEVLRLRYARFERMFGSLDFVQKEQYMSDPRKTIADFYGAGGPTGPQGACPIKDEHDGECTAWFAVYRPTSRDAITKMLTRVAVGKGLNVKGKSSKKNHLSGFVPFLQISNNEHKDAIEHSPQDARIKVFFQSSEDCERARQIMEPYLRPDAGLDVGANARIVDDERFITKGLFGLNVPERIIVECYIKQPDISFTIGWETGRVSEPAFMDMNLHAVRGESEPEVVLYQFDKDNPMNPHGLLIAYAEQTVKPVVSDFDTFTVGSRGMSYEPLPESQQKLAMWSLENTLKILESPDEKQWNSRWLSVLKKAAEDDFYPELPKYGFGDATSYSLIQAVIKATRDSGAVRHGAECGNFWFPQQLDEEYLVVWDGFAGKPWKYEEEPGLRDFLIARAKEGYCFPLNPVWPARDPGWYEVWTALRANCEDPGTFDSWYPPGSGLAEKMEAIHAAVPGGFVSTQTDGRLNGCEASDLMAHMVMKSKKEQLKSTLKAGMNFGKNLFGTSRATVHTTTPGEGAPSATAAAIGSTAGDSADGTTEQSANSIGADTAVSTSLRVAPVGSLKAGINFGKSLFAPKASVHSTAPGDGAPSAATDALGSAAGDGADGATEQSGNSIVDDVAIST